MARRKYIGVNVQYPISRLLADGTKTVETRTYPIPKGYPRQELLLIETPGRSREFKSRAIAKVTFGESFKYDSPAAFYKDFARHQVGKESEWRWRDKPKWGWPVIRIERLARPRVLLKKIGIRYTKNIQL